jgi:hypothetical protein
VISTVCGALCCAILFLIYSASIPLDAAYANMLYMTYI